MDDEFDGGDASGCQQQSVVPWPSLGSYEQGRKENVQKAGKWAGKDYLLQSSFFMKSVACSCASI